MSSSISITFCLILQVQYNISNKIPLSLKIPVNIFLENSKYFSYTYVSSYNGVLVHLKKPHKITLVFEKLPQIINIVRNLCIWTAAYSQFRQEKTTTNS